MKIKYLVYAMRPKQWIKNFFIFLPLIFGQKLFASPENVRVFFAFVFFCMASSAGYLINDAMDYEQDRLHPVKRIRPVAAGHLAVKTALTAAALLAGLAIVLSFLLMPLFGGMVLLYLVFNLLYTRLLKEFVIVDVFCLSAFFVLRVLAGTFVAEVALSHWILLMTALLALFLGFNKRRQELKMLGRKSHDHRRVLRKYSRYFIDQMISVITASTVVAYTLYTVDARTIAQLGSRNMLYTVPFVYYGIFRYLYILHKRRTEGDPTRVLVSDLPMQVNLALWIMTSVVVIYGPF